MSLWHLNWNISVVSLADMKKSLTCIFTIMMLTHLKSQRRSYCFFYNILLINNTKQQLTFLSIAIKEYCFHKYLWICVFKIQHVKGNRCWINSHYSRVHFTFLCVRLQHWRSLQPGWLSGSFVGSVGLEQTPSAGLPLVPFPLVLSPSDKRKEKQWHYIFM